MRRAGSYAYCLSLSHSPWLRRRQIGGDGSDDLPGEEYSPSGGHRGARRVNGSLDYRS